MIIIHVITTVLHNKINFEVRDKYWNNHTTLLSPKTRESLREKKKRKKRTEQRRYQSASIAYYKMPLQERSVPIIWLEVLFNFFYFFLGQKSPTKILVGHSHRGNSLCPHHIFTKIKHNTKNFFFFFIIFSFSK